MANRVLEMTGDMPTRLRVAEFLARLVADGEHPLPVEGDDDPTVWIRRMGWWWDDNPFCSDESPLGYVLETEAGEIVGFHGFIPWDYEVDGQLVPSLVATTFFVRKNHRNSVLGVMGRLRRLAMDYQIVDGTPSPEMRHILEKFDYVNYPERKQYLFPVRGSKCGPLGWLFPLTRLEMNEYWLTGDPDSIEEVPEIPGGKIHKKTTRESLRWLSRSGTIRRQFFGLCNAEGKLEACGIGIYKQKWGLKACRLMDYVDFDPEGNGVARLLQFLCRTPENTPLEKGTDLVIWSVINAPKPHSRSLSFSRDSILHYHLPDRWKDREKLCIPIEGDLALQ